jgi:hypothetical protein
MRLAHLRAFVRSWFVETSPLVVAELRAAFGAEGGEVAADVRGELMQALRLVAAADVE